jgi:hypothetical protein
VAVEFLVLVADGPLVALHRQVISKPTISQKEARMKRSKLDCLGTKKSRLQLLWCRPSPKKLSAGKIGLHSQEGGTSLRYYFRTFENSKIRMIDLKSADLDAKEIRTIPIESKEEIEDVTKPAK